jgi:hypothetical protein
MAKVHTVLLVSPLVPQMGKCQTCGMWDILCLCILSVSLKRLSWRISLNGQIKSEICLRDKSKKVNGNTLKYNIY